MLKTILVIDDQASIRSLFSNSLTTKGFRVITAEDGQTGIQLAQRHQPDLVICDIIMPNLDGYEVLSRLRQMSTTASIPFIFVTSKVTRSDLRKGMETGADDYLTKPCTTDELVKAIETQLEKRSNRSTVPKARLPTGAQPFAYPVKEPFFPSNSQFSEIFRFIESNYHHPINLRRVN